MQMCDKNAPYLAETQLTFNNLMLCSLATIEQPDFASLQKAQRNARYVTRPGWHARARAKKGNLQAYISFSVIIGLVFVVL
jgi:hypothetical protein